MTGDVIDLLNYHLSNSSILYIQTSIVCVCVCVCVRACVRARVCMDVLLEWRMEVLVNHFISVSSLLSVLKNIHFLNVHNTRSGKRLFKSM